MSDLDDFRVKIETVQKAMNDLADTIRLLLIPAARDLAKSLENLEIILKEDK